MTPTLPLNLPHTPTHILIVDDSAAMRDCVRMILQRTLPTARLREAEDGADALQALEQFPADVIISDLNMPSLDGRDLLLALRQTPGFRETPVLIMSGNDLDELAEEFKEDPHLAFLSKPFKASVLAKRVQRLLIHAAPRS